ncbi:hypothetical protein VKT23_016508 [Stygiomarasmius scandens]|uniref:Core-binding (CB) domain-containing protein n=1 Tax=Marasmiellus scandens TaxID=2682957 RepID=A0ABR1IUE5_9AGAR
MDRRHASFHLHKRSHSAPLHRNSHSVLQHGHNRSPTTTTSPNGSQPNRSCTMTNNIDQSIRAAMDVAVKPDTLRRHQNAIRQFKTWAKSQDLARSQILLASETTLAAFAASFRGQLAGGTVRAKISAVKAWHVSKGHQWHSGDMLRKVLTGVKRQAPPSSFHPERPGVSVEMNKLLHDELMKEPCGLHYAVLTGAKCATVGQL